jgi:hypothetical protein
MAHWLRGYFKRAVQPKCEVQGANCAVKTWKISNPKMSTFHLWWTEMSLINDKTMYIDIEADKQTVLKLNYQVLHEQKYIHET